MLVFVRFLDDWTEMFCITPCYTISKESTAQLWQRPVKSYEKNINVKYYQKIQRKLIDILYFKNSIFYLIGPWKLFLPIKISDLFVKGNNYFATAELGILSWKVILKWKKMFFWFHPGWKKDILHPFHSSVTNYQLKIKFHFVCRKHGSKSDWIAQRLRFCVSPCRPGFESHHESFSYVCYSVILRV